jgi:hypothetical protein
MDYEVRLSVLCLVTGLAASASARASPLLPASAEFQVNSSSADETTPNIGNDGTSDLVFFGESELLFQFDPHWQDEVSPLPP